jgi:hypothetical protein
MNKRTGLLALTKRKSLQSVHPPYLTINIHILLCWISCDGKDNAKSMCETVETQISGQHMRILPTNYDSQKNEIRKKTAFYMKTLMSNWD